MSMDPTARRYKEIVALAGTARQDWRAWEHARAAELDAAIAEARAAVASAEEAEQATAADCARTWRIAVSSMAELRWLEAPGEVAPDGSGRADRLPHYRQQIRAAYLELTESIRALGWRAR